MRAENGAYDSLLVVAFGGPEGPAEVLPFLERVLAGRNVPRSRMLEVAEHYHHFGGVSPINAQNRALVAAVSARLLSRGIDIPVHLGNRNASPFIADALSDIASDGRQSTLALYTSPYGSYSSCRQYTMNIQDARASLSPGAPQVHKIRAYFNHPKFIDAAAAVTQSALAAALAEFGEPARLVFTAHSIPTAMAASGPYQSQLAETARLVAQSVGSADWTLAFQSRSGSPTQPWLGPSLSDVIARHAEIAGSSPPIVVSPIGFLSDHMEVVYDLDVEAAREAAEAGVRFLRAATIGTHFLFVDAIVDLVEERLLGSDSRPTAGLLGGAPDECAADCCVLQAAR